MDLSDLGGLEEVQEELTGLSLLASNQAGQPWPCLFCFQFIASYLPLIGLIGGVGKIAYMIQECNGRGIQASLKHTVERS
jgi:hypothetical protein